MQHNDTQPLGTEESTHRHSTDIITNSVVVNTAPYPQPLPVVENIVEQQTERSSTTHDAQRTTQAAPCSPRGNYFLCCDFPRGWCGGPRDPDEPEEEEENVNCIIRGVGMGLAVVFEIYISYLRYIMRRQGEVS